MAFGNGHAGKIGRARGLELLRQVYAELHACLGDQYSSAELLKAAQSLIDIRNREYSTSTYQDIVHYAGYYSYSVDTMIERPWLLLENEMRCDNLGDERLALNAYAQERLRRLMAFL